MRISTEQIQQLHKVLGDVWAEHPYKLYLYGSRVHDDLKGGDIDLLIVTSEDGVALFENNQLSLLVKIKNMPAIGQRRIDIKAVTEKSLKTDAFLRTTDRVELK